MPVLEALQPTPLHNSHDLKSRIISYPFHPFSSACSAGYQDARSDKLVMVVVGPLRCFVECTILRKRDAYIRHQPSQDTDIGARGIG